MPTNSTKRVVSVTFLLTAVLASVGPLKATQIIPQTIPANEVYSWSGVCTDCSMENVTGTLTLGGTYTLGSEITTSNFVSFSYSGSNLLSPFTILDSEVVSIAGLLPLTLPGAANLTILANISSVSVPFETVSNGFWCAGSDCLGDMGGNSTYSAAVSSIPEPGSIALFCCGGALALLGARKLKSRSQFS